MKCRNWIFLDGAREAPPYAGLADGTAALYSAVSGDPVSEIEGKIAELRDCGELRNYVIVAADRAAFAEKFISNSVIDAGGTPAAVAAECAYVFSRFGREKPSRTFVIGDSHFYHKNIIKYCNRPWNSGRGADGELVVTDDDVRRMNEDMIARWNSVVGPEDVVVSTGDFCFGNRTKAFSICPRLNGRKRIILGNHDRLKFMDYYEMGFERVYDHPIVVRDFIIMSHEPLQWVKDGSVWLSVYAHVHDQEMYKDYTANTFCSSAERIDYTPIELDEIIRRCQSVQDGGEEAR